MVVAGRRCRWLAAAKTAQGKWESRTSEAIPFTLRDGYLIVVEGRIGAHGISSWFWIRARPIAYCGRTWQKSRSLLRRTVRIVNLDHVLTQELAEVSDFELGPIRIPLLPVMLNDLSYLRESVARRRWTYRFGRVAGAKFQH